MIYYPDIRNKVYFSQNREDLILEAFFPDVKKGFYVDIGAYDPVVDSVTKLFYIKGWRGINIEPQPDRIALFNRTRKKDINLNIGLSNKKGELKLRSYDNQGLSTFSQTIMNQHNKNPKKDETKGYKDISVKVDTLNSVLEKQGIKQIHFMKIDVEGYEYQVIQGNNWQKFRPEVICIEANHVVDDWRPLLSANGYKKVFNDGLNDYYVDEKTDREEKFDYVNNLLLSKGVGIAYSDYTHIENLRSMYEEKVSETNKVVRSYEAEKRQLKEIIEYQKIELSSIKRTTSHLIKNVKRRLKNG